jgi:hypothetical protein
MDIFIGILIGIGILWALITGVIAIVDAWKYCIIIRNSSKFLPYVFSQSAGNLFAILGILLFCIPVWIVLCIVIATKN